MSGTISENEWQQMLQRMTTSGITSDNEWYNVWKGVVQWMTASGTTSDCEL